MILEEENNLDFDLSDNSSGEELPQEQEPTSNTPEEPETPPVDNSSLTPSEQIQEEPSVIQEEDVLAFLSEKLGKTVNSFEELNKTEVSPLDSDPDIKALVEWRQKTGRPINDWFSFQKDYSTLSDLDVAREYLRYEYPTLTDEEINLEVNKKFVYDEDDLDDDEAFKRLELKKYASKGRSVLSELKSNLGEPLPPSLSDEMRQDLELAKKVKEDMSLQQQRAKEYVETITKVSNSTEAIKLNLSEDMSIDYKLDEADKKQLPQFIDQMPHWYNPDGSFNHQAVVNDAVKILNFDKIVQLAYEQGMNKGKDDLAAQANNTNFEAPNHMRPDVSGKGVQIEGLDEYLGNVGVKVRFGNK